MLCDSDLADVISALEKCGLPTKTDIDADTLFELTLSDKKSEGDSINLIIPREIGKCEICKTDKATVKDIIKAGL